MLVGAMPRRPGMERKDLLLKNAEIFRAQGKALDEYASKNVKVRAGHDAHKRGNIPLNLPMRPAEQGARQLRRWWWWETRPTRTR